MTERAYDLIFMKTLTLAAILLVTTVELCFAQVDTIYTNNTKIPCIVKEVSPELVKYSYPDEQLINSIYKNVVQKIVFMSGREEVFSDAKTYKKVSNGDDFENVTITQLEGEVKGLFKLGEITSSAQGGTVFSEVGRVQDRAQRKMQMVAAMMGGNMVYLTHQQAKRGGSGYNFGASYKTPYGAAAETFLAGIVYTNELPDIDTFKQLVSGKTEFRIVEKASLSSNSSEIRVYASKENLNLRR